jgi:hypothetical protein
MVRTQEYILKLMKAIWNIYYAQKNVDIKASLLHRDLTYLA